MNIRLFMQSTKERRVCDPYSPVTVNSQSKSTFNPRDKNRTAKNRSRVANLRQLSLYHCWSKASKESFHHSTAMSSWKRSISDDSDVFYGKFASILDWFFVVHDGTEHMPGVIRHSRHAWATHNTKSAYLLSILPITHDINSCSSKHVRF